MKRDRKTPSAEKPAEPQPTDTVAETQAAPASEKEKPREKERFQVAFDLNADGSPDLSTMRDRTRERVKEFFRDPKMAAAFGVEPQTQSPTVEVFNPHMIGVFYDGLGAMEAAIIPMFFKNIPADVAQRAFRYSPTEKELLGPPTTRVFNKYASEWMKKYADEIALAGLLMSITFAKCQAAIMLSKSIRVVDETPKPPENKGDDPKPVTN